MNDRTRHGSRRFRAQPARGCARDGDRLASGRHRWTTRFCTSSRTVALATALLTVMWAAPAPSQAASRAGLRFPGTHGNASPSNCLGGAS